MNWNDLESTWRRQTPQPPNLGAPSRGESVQAFETKSRKMARALVRRDWIEATAGLSLVVYWMGKGWHFEKAMWAYVLANLILLALTAFFVRERIRVRRMQLGPGAPILVKLDADLAELRRQRHLLLNVALWYMAPIIVASAIIYAVRRINDPNFYHGHSPTHFWVTQAVVWILVSWGVWALNQRAVRKKIAPQIAELEQLRANLLASE